MRRQRPPPRRHYLWPEGFVRLGHSHLQEIAMLGVLGIEGVSLFGAWRAKEEAVAYGHADVCGSLAQPREVALAHGFATALVTGGRADEEQELALWRRRRGGRRLREGATHRLIVVQRRRHRWPPGDDRAIEAVTIVSQGHRAVPKGY